MKIAKIKFLNLLGALLLLGISLNVASAPAEKITVSKANALSQTYTWHDGVREHKVWINPQVVADFNPGASKMKKLQIGNSTATPQQAKKHPGIHIWQLDNTSVSSPSAAIQSLKTSQPSGKYSPVFHEGPSKTSGMRALPGNIIVYLNPSWNDAAVTNWLTSHKLEVIKKLEIGPNIYLIKTGAGMEALEMANKLYKSGEVKAAIPDWWKEVQVQ